MIRHKKVLIGLVALVCVAALGTGIGIKVRKDKAEKKAAIEKEYKDYGKEYKTAEDQIQKTVFFDKDGNYSADTQEKSRKALSDKLTPFKSKIEKKNMTDGDKKSFKKTIEEIKKAHSDAGQSVMKLAQTALSRDTASLGEYYTDDIKTADEKAQKDYEKAINDGDYKKAYDSLNTINTNYQTASDNKTSAEQTAAQAEATAQADNSNTSDGKAADSKNDSKSASAKSTKKGQTGNSKTGSNNSASNGGSSGSSESSSGVTVSTDGNAMTDMLWDRSWHYAWVSSGKYPDGTPQTVTLYKSYGFMPSDPLHYRAKSKDVVLHSWENITMTRDPSTGKVSYSPTWPEWNGIKAPECGTPYSTPEVDDGYVATSPDDID